MTDDGFGAWLTGWNETCDLNQQAIGDGWGLASRAIALHSEALSEISESDWGSLDRRRAIAVSGAHSLRGLSVFLGSVVRGYFDVAPYLMRGMYDAQSLVLGCVLLDESFIKEVLEGRTRGLPGKARTGLVGAFKETDSVVAEMLNERFKKDYDAGNGLAHTAKYHLDRVLARTDEGFAVQLNGFPHDEEARVLWSAALEIEDWALRWISLGAADALSDEWQRRQREFEDAEEPYRASAATIIRDGKQS